VDKSERVSKGLSEEKSMNRLMLGRQDEGRAVIYSAEPFAC
jgi:hypothetical protein